MRPGIIFDVTAADRARPEAVVADRNSPQKHVWRAAIMLATADGLGTNAVMRRTGKSKTAFWRWQERFASDGVDGLLRDKTRPSRVAPFGLEVGERIVALTLAEPPAETTQWSGRAVAKATGVSLPTSSASGARTGCSRIASAPPSSRTTRPSRPRSATSSGCMSIRPPMPWSSPSTRRAGSRRSTARSPACP